MDNTKIGELICRLRKEQGMTPLQLAEILLHLFPTQLFHVAAKS